MSSGEKACRSSKSAPSKQPQETPMTEADNPIMSDIDDLLFDAEMYIGFARYYANEKNQVLSIDFLVQAINKIALAREAMT
jgi:hypothetical protein